MSSEHPLLERAISLEGDKNRIQEFYNDWADRYDTDMLQTIGYVAPSLTAEALAARVAPDAYVLDAGCGTGLVGLELSNRSKALRIDGLDLTMGMLEEARKTHIYNELVEGDLTAVLPIPDNTYDGIVSAGVFTNGHVGPQGLDELVRIAKPKAPIVLTVRDSAWEADGFKDYIADLDAKGAVKTIEIVHSPYHTKEDIFCQLCVLEVV
ncbi:MAG: class I SAM-dependent methyltransferase [Roseibium sp.]|nr:class I SAM-dependent methyltransferase [Roseibium sp.]